MATHEFVVPRSMPMTRSIQAVLLLGKGSTGARGFGGVPHRDR
jgi:hypothetical protein